MSIIDMRPAALTAEPDVKADIPRERVVVAAIVEWRGRIALFRRNRRVDHDSGKWHCISGYVEPGATPVQQVFDEIFEETGLQAKDISTLRQGPALVLADARGASWLVYTFTAVTNQRRLRLNWEHDSYRWTTAQKWPRFTNRVSWLEDVLRATGHLAPSSGCADGTDTGTRQSEGNR